jgi:hypothetical protein
VLVFLEWTRVYIRDFCMQPPGMFLLKAFLQFWDWFSFYHLYVHWPFLHRCYWSVHGCCTSSLNVGLHVFCSSSVSCERMSSEHVAIYKLCVICFRLRLSTFSSWPALICKLVTGFFTGLFLHLKVACLKLMWPQNIFLTVNVAMGKFCLRAACLNTVNSKYQI